MRTTLLSRLPWTLLFVGSAAIACSGNTEVTPIESDDGDMTATGDGDGAPGAVGGDGDGNPGDGDGTTAPAQGFTANIVGGDTQDGYETIPLTIGGDAYNVLTNPWGGAQQTITAGGGKVFEVTSITHPGGGNPWDVASFPSVYRGGNNQGVWTDNSGMPAQISTLSAVHTGLKTNSTSISYSGNTTYDVYFTNDSNYVEGGPDVYLMVWFHSNALNPINAGESEGWSCAGDAPVHIEACTTRGSVSIQGKTFHRFMGSNGHAEVISYAPETNYEEWEFDLKEFIDDAVAQGILNPNMYLVSVQAGFELADAGAGLTIYDYYVDVQ